MSIGRYLAIQKMKPQPEISGTARHVLIQLADHENDDTNRCDPGYGRLAKETGYGRKTVERAVLELREAGLISWVSGNEKETNKYSFHFPKYVAGDDQHPAGSGSNRVTETTYRQNDHRGSVKMTLGYRQNDAQTNKEPTKEPARAPSLDPTETDRMIATIAGVCGRDWETETDTWQREARQAAKELIKTGRTPDDVQDWRSEVWRRTFPGNKGEPPQPKDILKTIGQLRSVRQKEPERKYPDLQREGMRRLRAEQAERSYPPNPQLEAIRRINAEREAQAPIGTVMNRAVDGMTRACRKTPDGWQVLTYDEECAWQREQRELRQAKLLQA